MFLRQRLDLPKAPQHVSIGTPRENTLDSPRVQRHYIGGETNLPSYSSHPATEKDCRNHEEAKRIPVETTAAKECAEGVMHQMNELLALLQRVETRGNRQWYKELIDHETRGHLPEDVARIPAGEAEEWLEKCDSSLERLRGFMVDLRDSINRTADANHAAARATTRSLYENASARVNHAREEYPQTPPESVPFSTHSTPSSRSIALSSSFGRKVSGRASSINLGDVPRLEHAIPGDESTSSDSASSSSSDAPPRRSRVRRFFNFLGRQRPSSEWFEDLPAM